MKHLLLYFAVLSPVLAADTIIAPNPFDLLWLAALYVGLPMAALAIAFYLRRRPVWCAVWIVCVLAFGAYRFLEANPATSSKRADVTLVIQDSSGRGISGVQIAVTQYAEGRVPQDSVLTSGEGGRVTIVTTSDRKIHGTFRDPKFRYVAFRLDRAYKPTFPEGQFFYDWQVLGKNEKAYRSNTAGIESRFARDNPLSIPIVLPSSEVEDSVVESRMRGLLPPPYDARAVFQQRPNSERPDSRYGESGRGLNKPVKSENAGRRALCALCLVRGDHRPAGWSCRVSPWGARHFLRDLASLLRALSVQISNPLVAAPAALGG